MLRAAAVTPLPQAPDVVLGILDLHGEVVPVINLRRRFGLAEREIGSNDIFIVAHTATRTVVLVADSTEGLGGEADTAIAPDQIVDGLGFLKGVTRSGDGLVLIHDLDTLLFPAEEELLALALEEA